VAGLTDARAVLTTAGSDLVRRHSRWQWAVLAEQPSAVRAAPGRGRAAAWRGCCDPDAYRPSGGRPWASQRGLVTDQAPLVEVGRLELPRGFVQAREPEQ
jgi:hypothetical protein